MTPSRHQQAAGGGRSGRAGSARRRPAASGPARMNGGFPRLNGG
jgi:hypothetical protein